jgi:hypothetical protein
MVYAAATLADARSKFPLVQILRGLQSVGQWRIGVKPASVSRNFKRRWGSIKNVV